MTQKEILDAILAALAKSDISRVRELIFSKTDIPNSETLSAVMERASRYGWWGIVDELCQIQGDNQPTPRAVHQTLLKAVRSDHLESFQRICRMTGKNKPSQEAMNEALEVALEERALKHNWDVINFILFDLKPEDNQPGRATVDKVCRHAANNGHWTIVEKLCQPNARNKPSQAAVDTVLLRAVGVDRLDSFKRICGMTGENKPSRQGIENALRKAYSERSLKNAWSFVEFILFELKPDDTQPEQTLVDEVFKFAANNGHWTIVEKLCQPNSRNKPSQAAVDAVLLRAVGVDRLDSFKRICGMTGENKPSKQGIEKALEKAQTERGLSNGWTYIEYFLLGLQSDDNQPGQDSIDKAFKHAAVFRYWNIIDKLCQPDAKNKPSQRVVDEVLLIAVGSGRVDSIKVLCAMSGVNKPSQEAINKALRKTHTDRGLSDGWALVDIICAMQSDNQPEQAYVEEAYYIAANYGHWQLINKLSQMPGKNKPDQEAVEKVFVRAAGRNVINTVKILCQLETDRSPRAAAVSQAFVAAAKEGALDVISYLNELPAEKKPDSKTLKDAFLAAALGGHVNVVKYLYEHPELELDQALINEAVMNAASLRKGADVIEFFYEEGHGFLPDEQTKANAFYRAITKNSYEVVNWLVKNASLEQTVIDQGLINAVRSPFCSYLIVEYLLNSANPRVPGEAAVKTALAQISPDADRIIAPKLKSFLATVQSAKKKERPASSLPMAEESESSKFQAAVLGKNLTALKGFCSEIGTNNIKLADVKRAMKYAPSAEIKKCLQDAEKILKLQQRIKEFKAYGEGLQRDRKSSGDGDTAVDYAEKLSEHTKSYTKALFSDGNVKPAQGRFSETLKDAYIEMNNHSAEWKLWLKKIALAATVIGALISRYIDKGFFNTRTQRQTELAKIREEYSELSGEKPEFK